MQLSPCAAVLVSHVLSVSAEPEVPAEASWGLQSQAALPLRVCTFWGTGSGGEVYGASKEKQGLGCGWGCWTSWWPCGSLDWLACIHFLLLMWSMNLELLLGEEGWLPLGKSGGGAVRGRVLPRTWAACLSITMVREELSSMFSYSEVQGISSFFLNRGNPETSFLAHSEREE